MALSSKVTPPTHATHGLWALFQLRNLWTYVVVSYPVPSLAPFSVPCWALQMDPGHDPSPCLGWGCQEKWLTAALPLQILSRSLLGLGLPLAPCLSSLVGQLHSYCLLTISLLCVTLICISAGASASPLSCYCVVNVGKHKGEKGEVYSRWKRAV